jgi:hypothetical protein
MDMLRLISDLLSLQDQIVEGLDTEPIVLSDHDNVSRAMCGGEGDSLAAIKGKH